MDPRTRKKKDIVIDREPENPLAQYSLASLLDCVDASLRRAGVGPKALKTVPRPDAHEIQLSRLWGERIHDSGEWTRALGQALGTATIDVGAGGACIVFRTPEHESTLEVERLKSQVIAARQAELSARREAERRENQTDKLLECVSEQAKAIRALQAALIARDAGALCMHETHRGVVTDVEGDEVAVTYETEEGSVEQVYQRSQFVQGQLPEVGDAIEAHVLVSREATNMAERWRKLKAEERTDGEEFAAFREKRISGPFSI